MKCALNASQLKLVALGAMLIDHLGLFLFWEAGWMRIVGRLAFPIFAFQIAEGYRHTRNFRNYCLRLAVLALITEVLYDHALYNTLFFPGNQNILFTLLLGLIAIRLFDGKHRWLAMLVVVAGEALCVDYGGLGVLTILVFHAFREQHLVLALSIAAIHGIAFGSTQAWAIFALIPIGLYNGEKGSKAIASFGYLFYPLHLLILDLIA